MHQTQINYKLFTQINALKAQVQCVLNALRKKNPPDLAAVVNSMIKGDEAYFSKESLFIRNVLQHPEAFIKDVTADDTETVRAEIKELLSDFIAKITPEPLVFEEPTMVGPRMPV